MRLPRGKGSGPVRGRFACPAVRPLLDPLPGVAGKAFLDAVPGTGHVASCHDEQAAALQVAERFGPKARVVTLMADSGMKYLSTDLYRCR